MFDKTTMTIVFNPSMNEMTIDESFPLTVSTAQPLWSLTFPKTGAIPIKTEAKAERTCWDESNDNSYKMTSPNIEKAQQVHISSIVSSWTKGDII